MSKHCCHEKWEVLTKQPYIFIQPNYCLLQKHKPFEKKQSDFLLPTHATSQTPTHNQELPPISILYMLCMLPSGFGHSVSISPFQNISRYVCYNLVDLISKFYQGTILFVYIYISIVCKHHLFPFFLGENFPMGPHSVATGKFFQHEFPMAMMPKPWKPGK